MNIITNFTYDISFFDLNGEERGFDNFNSLVPVSSGDIILWHSCELIVDKVVHFVDGQAPSLHCKISKPAKAKQLEAGNDEK